MSKYIRECIYAYNMTGRTSDANRYMLQVGNNRFRRETWESIKDICAIEGTPMADEIWQALDTHVRAYAQKQDGGDGRIHMPRAEVKAEPEESMDNVFDKIVESAVQDATEEEVEEVVSEERAEYGRVATSDMFGHYRKK